MSRAARSQFPGDETALHREGGRSGDTLAPRWRGQPGRLEVWYATVSDPTSHTGFWLHQELVSPVQGGAFVHGIVTAFPAKGAPVVARYGPEPVPAARPAGQIPAAGGVVFDPPRLTGHVGSVAWDLRLDDPGTPGLFTFPAWAWEREALPAAQVVPVPSAPCAGSITVDGTFLELTEDARGDVAHIYGHGNAERWGWLHAELGRGDVLEVVSAVGRSPGLNRMPPLTFLQLRLGGTDWPRDPLLAAPLWRAELGLPTWRLAGTLGRWRLRMQATLPDTHSVAVQYADPDGDTVTCTNSELADAEIVLERRTGRRWEVAEHWQLRRCAHSEIGSRP
ncbi:MAG TPA: hypothetical protein VEI83_08290 [Acidimicrobiales bacterium]|nr:hypothetical protein [Acidimicrobiales bacterium]